MKKIIIPLFLLITGVLKAQLPSFSWEYSFPQNISVQKYGADTSGNIIAVGSIAGTVDLDLGPGVSSWTTPSNGGGPTEDGFVAKYNASGQLLWRIIFSSTNHESVNDMTLDASGNIYIKAVSVDSTVDLDPGAGTYFLAHPGNFIAKYSSSGQLMWANEMQTMPVFSQYIMANHMTIDGSTQDLILAGSYFDSIDVDPSPVAFMLYSGNPTDQTFFLAKYNTNGQLLWVKNYTGVDAGNSVSGHNLHLEQIKTDNAGNIFMGGEIDGTVDLDPSGTVSSISNSNYFAKYNSSGQLLSAQPFPGEIYSFDFDSSNNLIAGGWFVNLVDFDLGAGTQTLNADVSSNDFFIAKYDNNFSYIWAFTHSSTSFTFTEVEALFVDSNDDIIVYGGYDIPFTATDYDPGPGIYTISPSTGRYVAKYSSTSDLIWLAKLNGGPIANNVIGIEFNKVKDKLFMFGSYSGTLDFDLGSGSYNVTHATTKNFLARYDLECSGAPYQLSDTLCFGDTLHIGGQSLFSTGAFPVLLSSSSGCDSTVVANLFVYSQVVTNLNISLCSAQFYYFDGMNINTPGIYHDTLTAYTGCDSIINLTLSVVPVDYTVSQSGNILTAAESAASLQWYNCSLNSVISGATGNAFSVSSTANYAVIISKSGCVDTTNCMSITVSGTSGVPPANIWGEQYNMNAQFYRVDKHGNSYLIGDHLPAIDLDPDTGVFMPPFDIYGLYMLKYSPTGDFLWAKWIDSGNDYYIADAEVDTTGALYITGGIWSPMDMDPGPSVYTLSPTAATDVFISKYDVSGNFEWAHSFGTSGDNYSYGSALDKYNNIYLTGYFEDDIDFDPGAGTQLISANSGNNFNFIVKYDPAGNFISGIAIDTWIQSEHITIDQSDNIIFSGSYWGLTDIAPGPATYFVDDLNSSGTAQNAFVAKLDPSYSFITGFGISGDMFVQISDISSDINENILVTGTYRSSINDFDPGASSYALSHTGNEDVFLASYSSAGNLNWTKQIANADADYSATLVSDNNSNIYVLGSFSNTIDADGTPGMLWLNSAGYTDTYVSTFDQSGNFNWAFRVGSTGIDNALGMGLDEYGALYLCGVAEDTVPFMLASEGMARVISGGVYFGKYGTCQTYDNTVADNGAYFTSNDINGIYQWYDCNTNTPVAGATAQNFYPSVSGQYSVMVGNDACSVASACYNYSATLAEQDTENGLWKIYPNPANDVLNIQSNRKIKQVSFYDLSGRILFRSDALSENIVEIRTATFPDGVYFMNVIFNDGYSKQEKIVINR